MIGTSCLEVGARTVGFDSGPTREDRSYRRVVAQGDFTPPQDGSWRVDRGSSWGNPGVLACRTTMRYGYSPSDRNEHLGFCFVLRSCSGSRPRLSHP